MYIVYGRKYFCVNDMISFRMKIYSSYNEAAEEHLSFKD